MKTKKVFLGLGIISALAVAALPLTSYATEAKSDNITIDLEVTSMISMNLDTTSFSREIIGGDSYIDGATAGEDTISFSTTATITTNSTSGYTFKVASNNDDGEGYGLVGDATNSEEHNIAYASGLDSATEGFALKLSDDSSWNTTFASSGEDTVTSSTGIKSNATEKVSYGIKTASSTPTGKYATTLTLTATAQ